MDKKLKAGFVSGSMYTVDPQGYYRLRKHDYKSLIQWVGLFDSVVMFFSEVQYDKEKESWEVVTDKRMSFVRLCGHTDSILEKLRTIRKAAYMAKECDILYYRLPSYEPMLFHYFSKIIPYFIELHGDHETAILTSSMREYIKRPLAKIVARYTRKMCSHASFAYTIGEELMKKYVPEFVPHHVTTNHLTSIQEYPKDVLYHDAKSPYTILFVGAIQERKGLIFLFEALKIMSIEGIDFRMNLAGEGHQRNELFDYSLKNGFGDKVHFLGQVPHGEALYRLYRQADLFVLPSISAEGVPRVTHEAMIFGCPVIATDIGSIRWQLSGGAGLVIKPGDVDELYSSIKKVLMDKDYRRDLIRAGYEKSKLFSWEAQKEGNNEFARTQMNRIFGGAL